MMKWNLIATAFVAALAARSSLAGDTLRLRAGDLQLADESARLMIDALSREDSARASELAETRYFVVQFARKVTQAERDGLERQGFEILRYLPDDAYIVRGRPSRAVLLKGQTLGVRAIAAFAPAWKQSSELSALRDPQARVTVLVTVFDALEVAPTEAALERIAGVKPSGASGRRIAAQVPASAIDEIAALEGVEWIQEYPIFETFVMPAPPESAAGDPPPVPPAYTGYETGTKVMNFDAAWARGYYGEGQIAGMADTGLDVGDPAKLHPDFGNLKNGFALGLGSSSWEDSMGHGTHVAGSILGTGQASDGKLRGGAGRAQLVIESIWSPILDNIGFSNDLNALFKKAYDAGARVHSNSWGNPNALGAYDDFAHQVDEFMWNNPEMLVVFAAGNEGTDKDSNGVIDTGSVTSPGTAKNTLTVGASENLFPEGGQMKTYGVWHKERWAAEPIASDTVANNPNGLAGFSSRGPTKDLRTKPEIVSPGTNIVSARSHHPKAELLWGIYNDQYLYCGGTSMATPLTSGAALLTREFLIKHRGFASPSAALVKGTMMHTAYDLYPGQYGLGATQEIPARRPNVQEGYGRVDMDQATALETETSIVDDRKGLGTGETQSTVVHVASGEGLRATLNYTDAPASTSASVALVNDLDLEVVSPDGAVQSLKDRRNNHEMLELAHLPEGNYTVTVRGVNVPQGLAGKQPYALLVTHR
jgi:subtilisin family serine protease